MKKAQDLDREEIGVKLKLALGQICGYVITEVVTSFAATISCQAGLKCASPQTDHRREAATKRLNHGLHGWARIIEENDIERKNLSFISPISSSV